MESIQYKDSGLICDNLKCDWTDPTITIEIMDEWLNKPCPKCGENVLTEEDYENVLLLKSIVDMANEMSPEELQELVGNVDLTEMKKLPGMEDVQPDSMVRLSFNTHKTLSVKDIQIVE